MAISSMSNLPRIEPMKLTRVARPFDYPNWIFELKHDGFRAVAYVSNGSCTLISRKNYVYKSFSPLCAAIAAQLRGDDAVLHGEIICLGQDGRSQLKQLLYRRGNPVFYTFDLLWLNGRDLRQLPL